jgi:hypothetical protein
MNFIPFKKTVEGRKSVTLNHLRRALNFLVLFQLSCRVRNAGHFYISYVGTSTV